MTVSHAKKFDQNSPVNSRIIKRKRLLIDQIGNQTDEQMIKPTFKRGRFEYLKVNNLMVQKPRTLMDQEQPIVVDQGSRVLIVDDEIINRKLLKMMVKKMYPNLIIDQAVNGKVAVEMAREHNYDIIFMDIFMPVLDGVSASEQILEVAPKTIIIIVTADGNVSLETLGHLKVTMVWSKPLKREILRVVLDKYTQVG